MKIAIIGGGAAGFFAAINIKENHPESDVVIFEKSQFLLSKVRVSGGGRCNLTNNCTGIKELSTAYPRGGNALKKAFRHFDHTDAIHWFESRGVPLVTQEDNCVFPSSQNSQSIIDCFLEQAAKANIKIELRMEVKAITPIGAQLQLDFVGTRNPVRIFDKVIVTTGGSPRKEGLRWLEKLGHHIESPVPSLFSFKIADDPITELMGIVVEKALVSIQGTRLRSAGPLLVTHWGLSGPAILTLSSLGARWLNERNYHCNIQVNWTNLRNQEDVLAQLNNIANAHPKKLLANLRPFSVPDRLWNYLLEKSGLSINRKWGEIGKTGFNKLINVLTNDVYAITGQTQFRDEFVTCGGVSLDSIDINTMQSKACKNLYFAGEVMDIDGVTGGYNFQAAWTTAFIAAKLN
ncbi:NAD(P)/FAD-dependent oxidoreductase [uncultured Desulfuromusa sp.]|uniref:NAD(P)/FAD-dependent oxidoreductase n=1 Tax=uncultured Desulfuromusa sp. TaxID=219183 RepID=UPI002AA7555F|nr:NAD(P)/FAD-dependent oxidoreductase [uncultured Desulfuromusa sp.]